jgi:hypothetical protein
MSNVHKFPANPVGRPQLLIEHWRLRASLAEEGRAALERRVDEYNGKNMVSKIAFAILGGVL